MAQTLAQPSDLQQTASVCLHPLASRDGTHNSTIVEVQLPSSSPPVSDAPDALQGGQERLSSAADKLAQDACTPRVSAQAQSDEDGNDIDDEDDAMTQAPWGVQHDDLSQYSVVDDRPALFSVLDEEGQTHVFPIEDAPPIRGMTIEQFSELHARYNSLDVPHSVVFPFLHGVDGSNLAQNIFFKAPLMGQATPNYRGLTVVRADMPTLRQQQQQQQRFHSSSSASKFAGNVGRSRADSTSSSVGSHDASSPRDSIGSAGAISRASSDGGYGSDNRQDCSKDGTSIAASSSSASFASSMASSDRSAASLFSDRQGRSGGGSEEHSNSSRTSVSTSHAGDQSAEKMTQSPLSSMRTEQVSYDPQPDHSLLNASFYPCELIRPPVFSSRKSTTRYLANLTMAPSRGDALVQTATFYQPAQSKGVNLRNFNIQAAKYATLSDIVIYCPAGFHEGVLRLARWFREAQEANWQERQDRGLGGLRYNVFIINDTFGEIEKKTPHLVAVDHAGYSRNRVDFVDREREEMQRLTAASPIDENVWLGCTADVPSFSDEEDDVAGRGSLDPEWTSESNPHGFSICIQCHDTAEVPDSSKLSHASRYLDAVEATTLFEVNSKQALRDFDEEEKVGHGDDAGSAARSTPHLSLGPSGWTPVLPSRLQMGSLRRKTSSSSADKPVSEIGHTTSLPHIVPAGSNVVQLECSSLTSLMANIPDESRETVHTDAQLSRIADSVVNVCAWIKTQTQPEHASIGPQANNASSGHSHGGILAGALRSVQYHGRSGGGSLSTPGSPHKQRYHASSTTPSIPLRRHVRRVLIHCGDGYTESSVLALAYLMYIRGHSLPEAYLHLQNQARRSFFVFAKDLPFLKKLEQHIMLSRRRDIDPTETNGERAKGKHAFSWLGSDDKEPKRRAGNINVRRGSNASSSHAEVAQEQSVWARGLHGLVSAASGGASTLKKAPSHQGLSSGHQRFDAPPSRALTPTPKTVRGRQQQPSAHSQTQHTQQHSWFYNRRFEGSFPSRILPFLYLGNLNHAMNPAMLHVLGITHVVSVGESALHPPQDPVSTACAHPGGSCAGIPDASEPEAANSLWHEHQAGRISVLDLKNVCDDGIDPLRSTMRQAVEYIENARRSGGKVLVHCRVGVSRSTTIVLAYVMAHLDMSLVESYLMVRSRRLSILIQPHLLFFWELRGWETFLATQKLKRAAQSALSHRATPEKSVSCTAETNGSKDRAGITLASLSLQGRLDGKRITENAASIVEQAAKVGASSGFSHARHSSSASRNTRGDLSEEQSDLDVDIGAGAGSPYGFQIPDVERLPFGSGSPGGIPSESLRLSWGYLCREIAALNERYF